MTIHNVTMTQVSIANSMGLHYRMDYYKFSVYDQCRKTLYGLSLPPKLTK